MSKSLSASVILALLSTVCATARAQTTVFLDTFDSYANQPAFAGTWSADGTPPHVLDTTVGNYGQSVMMVPQASGSGTTNRWYRNLATPILPTDAVPVTFSFDFYLDPSGAGTNWSNDWQLADVRASFSGGSFNSGSLNGIVALAVARNLAGFYSDTYDGNYFQGRILAPGHTSQTYVTLDALGTAVPRSSGWHNMAARIGGTQTLFLVDGLPAEQVPFGLTTPISTVLLGSDINSTHTFWIDNVQLTSGIPEPTAGGLLLAIAGLGLVQRKRSRFQQHHGD